MAKTMKIGIISDTHVHDHDSLDIPDWIKEAFAGAHLIIHAGDVGVPALLGELSQIAPVYAVRGNCDGGAFDTPSHRSINIGCGLLTVAHNATTARRVVETQTRVMVYGHTHIALINQEENLLVINPGSPTLPRGGLPASVAILTIDGEEIHAELKQKP